MSNKREYPKKTNYPQTTPVSHNHLMGKVVLLIGNDTAVLQTLIQQLAQKGADIALVCRQLSLETVRLVKHSVESLGQRFLFIEETKSQPITPTHLVQTVVTGLGNLDVFIDISAKQNLQPNKNKDIDERSWPSWHVAQAVIKELV